MVATGVMTAVAALAILTDRLSPPAQPPQVRRVQVSAPELTIVKDLTIDISRDGGRLVYVGEKDGIRQLYLRPLDAREAKPIPNTEGALSPFFSPDGQWVAFWADQKLRKQPLSGGWTALYDAPLSLWGLPLAAAWNADGWILFSGIRQRGVLQRIRETGGAPEGLISADPKRNEWYLLQPELLPDGDHMLFSR